jgi:hypothetical protein
MTVYGVTVKDDFLDAAIKNFARLHNVKPTTAVCMMLERYAATNNREKQTIEKRLQWRMHRNKGFRRLTSFASQSQKQTAKAPLLSPLPNSAAKATA